MGIVSIYPDTTGQINVNPRRVKMVTTDGLSTVQSAGYLNSETLSTYSIYPTDVLDIIYSYVHETNSGTYASFLPSISNGVITLTVIPSSGGGGATVTLPTIANHIATYTNTTGNLAEDSATAINAGNIQAGLSGTAGSLISYPGTAGKGNLQLVAAANTGNTNVIVTNAPMGQATVLTIADPTSTTGIIPSIFNNPVTNNIPIFYNGSGALANSGVPISSVPITVTFGISQSQIQGMFVTPIPLLPAQGAGIITVVNYANIHYLYNTTVFAGGGNIQIQYDNTTAAGGINTLSNTFPPTALTSGGSVITAVFGGNANPLSIAEANLGLYLTNAAGAFTGGHNTLPFCAFVTLSYFTYTL